MHKGQHVMVRMAEPNGTRDVPGVILEKHGGRYDVQLFDVPAPASHVLHNVHWTSLFAVQADQVNVVAGSQTGTVPVSR